MNLRIEPLSEIPIYRQIASQLKDMILSGTLAIDEPLPSSRNLAIELKVNMLTVQKAFKELNEEELIYYRRGEGAFVSNIKNKSKKICEDEITNQFRSSIQKAILYGLNDKEIGALFERARKES